MAIPMWLIFTIIGVSCMVLFSQLIKLAVKDTHNDTASTILLQFLTGLFVMIYIPFSPIQFPTSIVPYALLSLAVLFYGFSDRMQITVRKHLEVSAVGILSQISTIFMLLYSILLYNETITMTKILGAGLILLGNIIVLYKGEVIRINNYFWLAIAWFFSLATAVSIDVGVSKQFNLGLYLVTTLWLPMFLFMLTSPSAIKEVPKIFNSGAKKLYILAALAWGSSMYFQFRGMQTGPLSTVIPLLATQVLLNVFIAYIFLKERDHLGKKLVAALFVIAGIYFTTF